jgi:CheY-like chemotaxis protein
LRILLAEDNKINQQFASFLLSKAGHVVTMAENGHQAVDALRENDFDVILMDIQMPELDGLQATRQIRAMTGPKSKIQIIAITAHAMAGAREEYVAASPLRCCRSWRGWRKASPPQRRRRRPSRPRRDCCWTAKSWMP